MVRSSRFHSKQLSGIWLVKPSWSWTSYQRAPFEIGLDAFSTPGSPYLPLDDLVPETRLQKQDGWVSHKALALSDHRGAGFGFGQGKDVVQDLSYFFGTLLPVGGYRMSEDAAGVAVRLWASLDAGATRFGSPSQCMATKYQHSGWMLGVDFRHSVIWHFTLPQTGFSGIKMQNYQSSQNTEIKLELTCKSSQFSFSSGKAKRTPQSQSIFIFQIDASNRTYLR